MHADSQFQGSRRVLLFAEDELATTGSAKIKTADLRRLARIRLDSASDMSAMMEGKRSKALEPLAG